MDKPLVSIIIPLYNAAQYIEKAILCIVNQTYQNWELIIVDDGSTDNSLAIAKKYESEKIIVLQQENKGQCAANNHGFSKSKGLYIKFFDADDMLSLNMIAAQVELLLQNPGCIASAKWGRFYNNDISIFKLNPEACWQDMNPIDWICTSWINGAAMMQCALWLIPKSIIEKTGGWNEKLSLINDLEFFTRIVLAAERIIFSSESILYYRSGHGHTLSARKDRMAQQSAFMAIDLSTDYLLAKTRREDALQCCANFLQLFIYDNYPFNSDLIKRAKHKIKGLLKPNIKIPLPGSLKLVNELFGWKVAKLMMNYKRKATIFLKGQNKNIA
ncbi:glycosyl transferase family 2 [Pedobacter sp. KBW01]|uniref:glycosyltransferase family 2 protein n=1 Tax=Pedobacter sp. KBW01 TaxID=2153364 RepID=UPI000F5AA345|nr:glycosyltransferase [Pedobacter sp. KBW01]RQO71519.1 glycosyl transferase family 2 [Pedobacter sp. KBW01]